MVDGENNKKRKTDLIKELFVKGKSGGWEMDTEKPIFQQEVTWGAWLSNPMSISLSSSLQSYRS